MVNSKAGVRCACELGSIFEFRLFFWFVFFGEAKENERHVVRTMSTYVLSADRKLDTQMDR
jgi:hypothetical protein